MSKNKNYLILNSNKDLQQAVNTLAENVECYGESYRAQANYGGRTFINEGSNMSVRGDYNRADYDYYRIAERVPTSDKGIIDASMKAYDTVGILHNVIDLMGDFTVQGIRITHPNPSINKFYQQWWKTIAGYRTSERIANMVYRTANAPVKTRFGTIPIKYERKWKEARALQDDIDIQEDKVIRRRIPLAYDVLNPMSLDIIGGQLAVFSGKPIYMLSIDPQVINDIRRITLTSRENQKIGEAIKDIPQNIIDQIKAGAKDIVLDSEKIQMIHYKKDSWLPWARPIAYAILNNLIILEKMHLADVSALDGAISQIRLWKLGDLDKGLVPSPVAINKLRNILASVGMGVLDLVWGPDIDFKESNTNVHNFLGPNKYQQVMSEIYEGLGIPPSLTGGGGGGTTGFTNNFISLKTLIERLEYGREIITEFWDGEIKKVQKAMGFRLPATVMYDNMVLSDESTEKKLFLELWDRDVISTETLMERFDCAPDIERVRVKRDVRDRESGKLPDKASPYHNPLWELELKKIILSSGGVAPSELGVNLLEKKAGEEAIVETVEKTKKKYAPPKATGTGFKPKSKGGRPGGAKDSVKRKPKKVKPISGSSAFLNNFMWATEAQKEIADIINPGLLTTFGKKNMRSLTEEEKELADNARITILCNLMPFDEISQEKVYEIAEQSPSINNDISGIAKLLIKRFSTKNSRMPNSEEMKQIWACAYSVYFEENEDVEN